MTEVELRGAHATVRAQGLEDEVAVEEPLEIRVDGRPLAVTMRTPGEDAELARGLLYGEGLIDTPREAGPPRDLFVNTIEVMGPLSREPSTRAFYTSSSCGIWGKGALEEVAVHAPTIRARSGDRPRAARVAPRPPPATDVRAHRRPARRGPLHAAGELIAVREDVGRHNALDKVIGYALAKRMLPLHPRVICVSGRLSFELVQKAAVARAAILVGVGAPSSLAIRLADDRNLTLAGFVRDARVNVYTGAERVT